MTRVWRHDRLNGKRKLRKSADAAHKSEVAVNRATRGVRPHYVPYPSGPKAVAARQGMSNGGRRRWGTAPVTLPHVSLTADQD